MCADLSSLQIPETPDSVQNLDLMKLLEGYAQGEKTWRGDSRPLGPDAKQASRSLHTHIVEIVEEVFASILDRVTARELDTFTMHDRNHGKKVAHLMWHILSPARRETLTPPEIGMLVLSAHLHDAGMALSREEREARLSPESDLWTRAEASPDVRRNLGKLRQILQDKNCPDSRRRKTEAELLQAEDALLALDTRERHAVRERYVQLIEQIRDYHDKDRARIPDIEECLSFDGESIMGKLIDICVSHNEDAEVLVEKDKENFARPRFPREYPVGMANADTQLVAAALRLADILDFDRERTPPILFHYLIPGTLGLRDNISALEWSKHMAISNWEIGQNAIVFRGRCKSHIVHHAIVQFCRAIEEEISATQATFDPDGKGTTWPFDLPVSVQADIHEEGYHYVPYQFELDDDRVYQLLMGGAIYDNPLMAVRELVQNAVDACSYRDALTQVQEPSFQPDTKNRITITYEEPSDKQPYPILRVTDTGTGMDKWAIERWFLKVGRSFYNSTEFNRSRIELRKQNVDFAPVSEFGIGFLSCFLLADRVEVETAMWEPMRGDIRKRDLEIDGPARLIRIKETANEGLKRFKGTRITLHLTRGTGKSSTDSEPVPPTWEQVEDYLRDVCLDLPYRLNLEYAAADKKRMSGLIDPRAFEVDVPEQYKSKALRIPVVMTDIGLEGQIAIVPSMAIEDFKKRLFEASPIVAERDDEASDSVLVRGGFKVGDVPGLPGVPECWSGACIKLLWRGNENRRYSGTNLARTSTVAAEAVGASIFELWLRHLIASRDIIPDGFMSGLDAPDSRVGRLHFLEGCLWLQEYDAFTLYELARNGWHFDAMSDPVSEGDRIDEVAEWEAGRAPARLRRHYLYGMLLGLILPRVALNREVDHQGQFYLLPPVSDWRQVLRSCHDFLSNPVQWPIFAVYRGPISEQLYSRMAEGTLNERVAQRLSQFSQRELLDLSVVLTHITYTRLRQQAAEVSQEDGMLLQRAIDVVGELEVSWDWETRWRLDSFAKKNS